MSKKRKYIQVKMSPQLKNRLDKCCQREGITQTSLVQSCIYQFVKQIESGEEPCVYNLDEYRYHKTFLLQIEIPPNLYDRLKNALSKTGMELSSLVRGYLLHFCMESESHQSNHHQLGMG